MITMSVHILATLAVTLYMMKIKADRVNTSSYLRVHNIKLYIQAFTDTLFG